jgi:uncharacterized membrane protein YeaQ/YmgE (transglycosylase-associated protein family)
MTFAMFATCALVGTLAGVLASYMVPRDGHGLKVDIGLGLAGSLVGSVLFRGLVSAGDGMFGAVSVAFIGAALLLVAQRKFRPAARPVKPLGSSSR